MLKFLDLSENRLSGEVPAWIGESLSTLVFLSLRSNEFSGNIPLHLCQLIYIQILDLSLNNLSGTMPKCLNNFTAMATKAASGHDIENTDIGSRVYGGYGNGRCYGNKAFVEWKGRAYEYERNLGLLTIIDLSGNELTGEIPVEIADLFELVALNLSGNNLDGVIPREIGQLKQLQSLDLSRNHLSGSIPTTIADLSFLSLLDLSYSNLSGKIPSCTQLQSFDASAFFGNLGLCRMPLSTKCPGEDTSPSPTTNDDGLDSEENAVRKWFHIGVGTGFIASFWGVLGVLLLTNNTNSIEGILITKTISVRMCDSLPN